MTNIERYLDGRYFEKNPTFHAEDSPWKAIQIYHMIERNQLSPETVCEVGCGAGEILRQLGLKLDNVLVFHGYEISPQAFELCKPRENEKLKFFNSDLFDRKQTNYDLVLCIDVFEHIEDCFTFLRQLRRQGDHFIFHIPLDMNVQMVLRSKPILDVREKVGHLHYFSKDTAVATLKDTGYDIVDWFYTPNGVERPKSLKAKVARIPRLITFSLSKKLATRIMGGYSLMVYARPSTAGSEGMITRRQSDE